MPLRHSIVDESQYIRKFSDIVFLNINEEEFLSKKTLTKHMSLNYVLKNLKEKKIMFSNPETWPDPYEKRFINAKYLIEGDEPKSFPWKGRVYCSCFTQEVVSEAHWKIHSHSAIPMEFTINRYKLLDEVSKLKNKYHIYVGKVEYLKQNQIQKPLSEIPFNPPPEEIGLNSPTFLGRLLLLKRNAYQYEDEFRIILVRKSDTVRESEKDNVFLNYSCHNYELYSRIRIGPEELPEVEHMIKEYLQKPEFDLSPAERVYARSVKVQKSALTRKLHDVEIRVN